LVLVSSNSILFEILLKLPEGKLFKNLVPSDLPAYLPVKKEYLLGLQMDEDTKALLKTNPFEARLSMMGV
jgi:hypothetical protein